MNWYGKVDSLWGSLLPKIRIISKNASSKSCWALNFVQKNLWAYTSISPRSGAAPKIVIFWNIIMFKNGTVDSLWGSTQRCQKYTLYPKIILPIKVVRHWILYKKVSRRTRLSPPPQSGAMGLCTEFNAQRLLFEAFSHIMCIFGSLEPQSESTFPFQYNIIFETYQSLEPLTSTLEGGRHVHPLIFFVQNSLLNHFYWNHFWILCVL